MKKFILFSIVGLLGTLVNLTVFYFAFNLVHFDFNVSSILAFFIAVTSNYIFNSSWTFLSRKHRGDLTIKDWASYIAGNIQGLIINLFVLNLLMHVFNFQNHILAQLVGIFSGMLFNYYFVKKFVFK